MAKTTKISWCDHTINPWIGCFKVSKECQKCYAETQEKRYGRAVWGKTAPRYKTKTSEAKVREFNRAAAKDGVKRTVFCASLSDFFEENQQVLPWREEWWDIIKDCNSLNWLILTKRDKCIQSMVPVDFYSGAYKHVNLGVSVGIQESLSRLDSLRQVPDWGGLRWTSMEPLLESLGSPDLSKIDWAIVGGESTPDNKFTVMQDDWVEEIKAACEKHGTTFHFKQNSARAGRHVQTFRGQTYLNWPKFAA